jgi:two-component system, chemotaxis family, CheB/CheR fusion protein
MGDSDERSEALLEYLKSSRGFDFTAYKRASLLRRIDKRMQTANVSSPDEYREYLQAHPEEFGLLFNTVLINVTSFFRDPESWKFLATEIVPLIVADTRPDGIIRVWSAGCASGEEPYTLAMVLAEAVGLEQFRRRVKIYASDIDEDALMQGRHATYSAQQVRDVPPDLLSRYFDRVEDRYLFLKDLRRSIIFGRHDLVHDAPIPRLHLLACRNTLMYFTRETQANVLSRFHFALRNGGFLFMGRAELLLTHTDLFTPVDLRYRVFAKVVHPSAREELGLPRPEQGTVATPGDERIRSLTLENDPVARIVLRADGTLAIANSRARALFRLSPKDLGKRLQDLELSSRPVELRSLIEDAAVRHGPVTRRNVLGSSESGESGYLDVEVIPLADASGEVLATQVSFIDVTRAHLLQEELERSRSELETTNEELQSTNEELETTNEELQSTNEELETTNEELQSTNEELETMNEELQATNEEFETTNTELQQRSQELDRANAFLSSILSGLEAAVAVVDPGWKVLAWNHRAEDLWGLRSEEVRGRHLMNLDIGLPVEQLRQPVRAVLAKETRGAGLTLDCRNRRGKVISCRIRCTPLSGATGEILGVILMMEEGAPPS